MPTRPRMHQSPQRDRERRQRDQYRGSSAERGYDARWRKARAAFLLVNPLCRFCDQQGRVTPATVVDHIVPHKGDAALFWNEDNWQSLCAHCHNSHKQRQEHSGNVKGCDADGNPLGGWAADRQRQGGGGPEKG